MKAHHVKGLVVALVVALALTLSATMAWAVATDYSARNTIPAGVTIVGRDLSGMTAAEARAAITEAVAAPMMRPLTVTGGGRTWTLDPAKFVSVNVDAMVNEAYSTRRSAPLIARLENALQGTPLPNDIKPEYSVDTTGIAAWVAKAAGRVDKPARDSKRTVVGYGFKISQPVAGAKVDQARSARAIARAFQAEAALDSADRKVAMGVEKVKPKVTPSSFGQGIVVSLNRCRIYLYNGDKLVKSYPCAPGQAAYPTPTGDFKVVTKLAYSSWINPHSSWSMSMPDVIGPGPNNPMGVHKIGIDYPGVFMHGIPPGEFGSIGTHASHGCMRMFPSDVADLFKRVRIGDPVFIKY